MGKIFETDEEIVKMIRDEFSASGLERLGLNLRVMSLKKSKDVIKASKASATTEFVAQKEDMIQVFVYEDVFNSLDEESQKFLIKFALSGVSYDSEKDKILIESNPYQYLFNMRKQYGDRADEILEASYLAVKQASEKSAQEATPSIN